MGTKKIFFWKTHFLYFFHITYLLYSQKLAVSKKPELKILKNSRVIHIFIFLYIDHVHEVHLLDVPLDDYQYDYDPNPWCQMKHYIVEMSHTKNLWKICIQSKVMSKLVIWAIIAPPHGSRMFSYPMPNRVKSPVRNPQRHPSPKFRPNVF